MITLFFFLYSDVLRAYLHVKKQVNKLEPPSIKVRNLFDELQVTDLMALCYWPPYSIVN